MSLLSRARTVLLEPTCPPLLQSRATYHTLFSLLCSLAAVATMWMYAFSAASSTQALRCTTLATSLYYKRAWQSAKHE